MPVRGGPQEERRLLLARLPRPPEQSVSRVAAVLRAVALATSSAAPPLTRVRSGDRGRGPVHTRT